MRNLNRNYLSWSIFSTKYSSICQVLKKRLTLTGSNVQDDATSGWCIFQGELFGGWEALRKGRNLHGSFKQREDVVNMRIHVSSPNRFMPCISYYGYYGPIERRLYLQSHIDESQSINHICLVGIQINQEIVSGNFHELMLKHCERLKCIYLQNTETTFNGMYEWLLQEYPLLEHLELIPDYSYDIIELNEFFQRNPKDSKRLSTNGSFLWVNRHRFLKLEVELYILEVKHGHFHRSRDVSSITFKTIWDYLQ